MQARLADPDDPETFERCKLDLARARAARRGATPCTATCSGCGARTRSFRASGRRRLDGAVLGPEAFVLRYFGDGRADDRLLLVNLGRDLHLEPAPSRCWRRPTGRRWEVLWSSEDPRYGGSGAPPPEDAEGRLAPARAARPWC